MAGGVLAAAGAGDVVPVVGAGIRAAGVVDGPAAAAAAVPAALSDGVLAVVPAVVEPVGVSGALTGAAGGGVLAVAAAAAAAAAAGGGVLTGGAAGVLAVVGAGVLAAGAGASRGGSDVFSGASSL